VRLNSVLLATVIAGCAATNVEHEAPTPMSQRWVPIGEFAGATVALDTASVVPLEGGRFRVWITTTFPVDKQLIGKTHRATRKLVDLDCPGRMARLQKMLLIDSKGRVVFVSEYPDPAQARYRTPDPETPTEAELTLTCRALVH